MPMDKPSRGQRVDYKALNEGKAKDGEQEKAEITSGKLSGEPKGACGGASESVQGRESIFSPEHSEEEESGDDELRFLQEEFEELEKEKRRLRKEKLKEELCRKINRSRDEVKRLQDPASSSKKVHGKNIDSLPNLLKRDSEVDLKQLRSNTHLKKKVNRHLQKLGLSEFHDSTTSSDSDNTSISDTSSSSSELSIDSVGRHSKKYRKGKSKKKSGISAKSADRVKYPQLYPHSQLRYEFVNQNCTFEDLNLNLFVAGELEIIGNKYLKSSERKGRINLLKKIMYLSSSFSFSCLKSYYAAVLREIELGNNSWDDDFSFLDTAMLSRGNKEFRGSKGKKNSEKVAGSDVNSPDDKVWFCSPYQRNKCQFKGSHMLVVKGKMRNAQHICATCWQKDHSKLEHPECSSACPHCSA